MLLPNQVELPGGATSPVRIVFLNNFESMLSQETQQQVGEIGVLLPNQVELPGEQEVLPHR